MRGPTWERSHSSAQRATRHSNILTDISYLKTHERIHSGEILFKCTKCAKSFSTSSYLKNHEKIQSGEIPCKCRNCDKNFSTSWYFETHETTQEISHSSAQSVTKVEHEEAWEDPHGREVILLHKVWQCSSRSTSLKEHERTYYRGEKPFNCPKCDKNFSLAGHLKEHDRTQTGEKPFKCTKCAKSFSTSSYLKNHEKIQSGEIPCKCRNCDKNFSTSWYLDTHETTQDISHSSAQSVTKVFLDLCPWWSMRVPTQERGLFQWKELFKSWKGTWEDPYRREVIWVHKVWQYQVTWKTMR